jgi:putative toxin-antitoxin system antitoxin component (TIGR02293 family)
MAVSLGQTLKVMNGIHSAGNSKGNTGIEREIRANKPVTRTIRKTTSGAKPGTLQPVAVRIVSLLDMKPAPKKAETNSAQVLVNLVRAGVTRSAFDKMLAATGLAATELAGLIHISDRTLRRYKPEQTFSPEQSERMVELASLYSRGEEVFGSLERFREWMGRPQLAFGNVAPKTYLDTSIGIGMIMDELGRIEHGIFA